MRVIATDSSRDALVVAESNALSNGVADRVEFRHGDLLAPITERVDIVCANLPYLPDASVDEWVGERSSLAFEPREAVVAGADGLGVIRPLHRGSAAGPRARRRGVLRVRPAADRRRQRDARGFGSAHADAP